MGTQESVAQKEVWAADRFASHWDTDTERVQKEVPRE